MIVEYLRYAVEDGDAFIAAYQKASGPLLSSPHCLSFDLCQCIEEPSKFILRIEWSSAEDHMQKFRGSVEFRAFFAEIKPYLDDIEEMRHYERRISNVSES